VETVDPLRASGFARISALLYLSLTILLKPHLKHERRVHKGLHIVDHVVHHDCDLSPDVADDVDWRLLLGRQRGEGRAHAHAGHAASESGRRGTCAAVKLVLLALLREGRKS
jgi:hypothetical protein